MTKFKYKPRLTVGRLRELIQDMPDDMPVVARVAIESSVGSLYDAHVTKGRTVDEEGTGSWWGIDADEPIGRDAESCFGRPTRGPVVDVLLLDDDDTDWTEEEGQ